MGRKTHGPYLVAAIELNDIQKVSDILSTKFRDKSKVKTFLASEVKRLASEYSEVPLLLAASLEDPTIIKYMVQKHDANINYIHEYGFQKPKKRKSALLVAVKRGLYGMVDAIISLNADVNVQDHKGRTPLHHAIKRADYRMVKLLLSRGAQVMLNDISGNSPLHVATIYGHSELIKLLLKYGGDLYKKGQYGAIPIHIAAREGHSSIVKLFYDSYEVNPDIKVPCYDELEKTPLHVAASQGNAETVYVLLTSCAADVNLRDSEGSTALHHTVLNDYDPLGMKSKDDYAETVKVLLNAGAIVNFQNGRGETALHLAARSEFQKVIEILVLAGCDPLIEDNDKNRALDLVSEDDAVSKQTLKNAIANRDVIMHNSAEVRSYGFQTNFSRGALATNSNKSFSLLNMNGTHNLNASRILTPSFGSQNILPHSMANVYQGSHSSSNSKESMLSGSKILPKKPVKDQVSYNNTRRAKSVEDLDHKNKTRKHNHISSKKYPRKNSYQESEATSMWSVTPPGSLQDLSKKKHRNKNVRKNPETIIENHEYDFSSHERNPKYTRRKKDDEVSIGSEDYYLDDESVEMLDNNAMKSSKFIEKDRVARWVENQKSGKRTNDYSSDSESNSGSSSFYSNESSDEYDDQQSPNKHGIQKTKSPNKKNKSKEQIIELDVTGDDDHTTIKVIPIQERQRTRGYSDSKTNQPPEKPIKQTGKTEESSFKSLAEKPTPKKRTNVTKNSDTQNSIVGNDNMNKSDNSKTVSQTVSNSKKIDKPNIPKKTGNLVFTKALDQSLDNLEHSNLARISAGDSAIPAKPTYSSIISPALSNTYLENSSKCLQLIHLKLNTSDNYNDNSLSRSFDGFNATDAKSFQTHLSRTSELEESNKDDDADNSSTQRIVSYSSDGSLPFTIIGGNEVGIYVDSIDKNSSAFKNGLSPGDKIIKVNEHCISGNTKEEVDNLLRQNLRNTTLAVIEDNKKYITLDLNLGGDSVYVKSYFKSDAKRKNDLSVYPGDIFHVVDTLPQGNPGFWKAKRINSKQIQSEEGLIPNQQRAEQQVLKEKLLSNNFHPTERGGTFFRSFRRSKSNDRNSRDNASASIDENESFSANIPIVYDRVVAKKSKIRRPVVILGLFCDVVIKKLVKENPILFNKPGDSVETNNPECPLKMEIIETSLEDLKHLLIILSPPSVEYMLRNTNLNPIVIYLSPVSPAVVKSVKLKLAPNYKKDANYMFEEASKFEKNFANLFSTVVGYTTDEWWYHNLKEAINAAQKMPVWQAVSKNGLNKINDEKLSNGTNVLRKDKNKRQNQANRVSHTTDDLPEIRIESERHESSKNKITSSTNQLSVKPEIKQKPKFQAKKVVNYSVPAHETPL